MALEYLTAETESKIRIKIEVLYDILKIIGSLIFGNFLEVAGLRINLGLAFKLHTEFKIKSSTDALVSNVPSQDQDKDGNLSL